MEAAANHYATLGVEPEADSAAIRTAYRNLMRRYHPDVNQTEEAAEKATAINAAYACLGDADARAAYDWQRRSRRPRPSPGFSAHPAWQPPPRHHYQPRYNRRPDHDLVADLKALAQPHKWNWPNLCLAMLITGCTFWATSFVSPIVPAPATTIVPTAAPGPDHCAGDQADLAPPDCKRRPASASE